MGYESRMARMYRFAWDLEKAAANKRKHRVSFDEATSVFEDPELAYFADLDDPERFIAIGHSALARVLVVVHLEASGYDPNHQRQEGKSS